MACTHGSTHARTHTLTGTLTRALGLLYESTAALVAIVGSLDASALDYAPEGEEPSVVRAVRGNKAGAVDVLLGAGASPHVLTTDGVPLAVLACGHAEPNVEVLQILIANGADVNAAGPDGRTALLCACEIGAEDTVKVRNVLCALIRAAEKQIRMFATFSSFVCLHVSTALLCSISMALSPAHEPLSPTLMLTRTLPPCAHTRIPPTTGTD